MKNIRGQTTTGTSPDKDSDFYLPEPNDRCFAGVLFGHSFLSMSNFFSLYRLRGLAFLALAFLTGMTDVTVKAQTSFVNAQAISGTANSVTNDNTLVVADKNAPNIAGFTPNAPLWYQWQAPQSGEVELDTLGSLGPEVITNITFVNGNLQEVVVTNNFPLDTALAVYTGTILTGLSQVAANDNLFPVSTIPTAAQQGHLVQEIESSSGDYATFPGVLPEIAYPAPYYGPSHLRFNAVANQTYYIAVDTEPDTGNTIAYPVPSRGPVVLNWAYQSSGVFRFATEDFDSFSALPLYQTAGTESAFPSGTANDVNSTILTYYSYNVPGVLVTVTRVAGSSGRCTVGYSTVPGTNLMGLTGTLPFFDAPGVPDVDYLPVQGQLVFDDYEMSKTIMVPIVDSFLSGFGGGSGGNIANVYFGIVISNAQPDLQESADISRPRIDPTFSTAMIKILNPTVDPYGPDLVTVTNVPIGSTNQVTEIALAPTNVLFGFQKCNYRVPEDVDDPTDNQSSWTHVALYVERFGTNRTATTLNYTVNSFEDDNFAGDNEQNIEFPLQPGSDYAVPTPAQPNNTVIRGTNSDFNLAAGTISFPATGVGATLQEITFTVPNSAITKFNKDFKIDLYRQVSDTPWLAGMVSETTVTILFNDQHPPAGSVDQMYNADFDNLMSLDPIIRPHTTPSRDANPGVSGVVYSVAMLTNDEALIAGSFVSYNGFLLYQNGDPINNIILVDTNGNLDQSFSPNSGADGTINSTVVTSGGQYIIGGNFVSFNGGRQAYLDRINSDGSEDTSFAPTVNDAVQSVALQPDGKIVIGGLFTVVDNQSMNYLARLNADGSLDTSFNPGATLNGNGGPVPVSAVAVTPASSTAPFRIVVGGAFSVNNQAYANIARFTTNGLLDTATFTNVFAGADNPVNALTVQPDGKILVGGAFTHFNGVPCGCITRLNFDGSIDTTNFFTGIGANDIIWNINLQTNGTIYVGGQFTEFNGTHRLGFLRLYPNGSVDTTFMDTAYNQFAGLKKIFANDPAKVVASGVESDGNIIIGGEFNQVGGGEADTNVCNTLDDELGYQESFNDPFLWVEAKTRDGVRNRSGVARLIGGVTPGPGNFQMQLAAYSQNKDGSLLSVGLVRTNGTLGPMYANFSVVPGAAQSGRDYVYDSTPPLYWVSSQYITHPTRERSEGLFGLNGSLEDVFGLFLTKADLPINNQSVPVVTIVNNAQTSGNLNAQFQLANPSGASDYYLGAENIPLGAALGSSAAPFTIIDDSSASGTFSYYSTNYIATSSSVNVGVVRSNGVFNTVTMRCFATNGTAVSGVDYRGVTNFSLQFQQNVVTNFYTVTILPAGLQSTNFVGKTINLALTALSGGNATFGISNAVITLINSGFQGYLTLGATNYSGNENGGSMNFIVNRVAGNSGQVSVQYSTVNGTATSGVNYIGVTNNQLRWSDGDVSPRIVTIPLLNSNLVGGSEQFSVRLFNPTNSSGYAPSLFYNASSPGSITNATLTITNNDSYGALQFSAPSYLVSVNGGYITLTVVRTGGVTGNVSVNYGTSNGSNTTVGVNYMATNGTLTFAPNQAAASFNVFVANGGTQFSSNFFFNVTLSNPINAALGSPTNAMVNLLASTYNQSPGTSNGLFNASFNGGVLALVQQTNGQILAGGSFTAINGAPQHYIARLNADGSQDTGFSASAGGPVQAVLCQSDGNIVLGGAFNSVNARFGNNIARVLANGFLDTSFNPGPGANGAIYALAETFINGSRGIYVGGAFSAISSGSGNNTGFSPGLARLNNNGTLDTSFTVGTGADGTLYAIALYPTNSVYAGDLLVGGGFVHYNGATVNGIARLTPSGAVDTTFNPGGTAATNGVVDTIVIQPDGRILIGGSFSTINGNNANDIARLNADGSTDTSFMTNIVNSGANNTVNDIVLQPDNRILVVGQFTQFNNLDRNGVTRILSTGVTDPTINFGTGVNGSISAVLLQPSTGIITLGGSFSQYNGLSYNNIVQIYGLSLIGSGSFQFSAGSYQVLQTGIVAPITILRTGGTSGANTDGSGDIFVNFSTLNNSNTAVVGVNYFPVTTNIDFPPGESAETVDIPILDDVAFTTNSWTVYMTLSSPTPPAVLGGNFSDVPLNILNVNSAINFKNTFTTVFENVAGGLANIDIIRLGATNAAASIDFMTTTNGSTAVAGVDYFPTNEIINFNPGDSDVTAQVLIISNNTLEKTVALLLTNPVNTLLFAPSNSALTIIDSVSPPGELLFASPTYTVNESSNQVVVTVLRTNGFSGTVTYGYTTVPGTALPNVNYQSTVGTLTFNNNVSSQNIAITLLRNNPPQSPVNFSVILTNTTITAATLIAPTNTVVTIIDDINTGVSFLNATNTFLETNATVTVPVERLGNTNNAFTVQFFTTNGTATAGVNYITNSGTLSFAAGQTISGIPITLLNNQDSTNVQFGVALSSPSAGTLMGSPSNAVVVLQGSATGVAFANPTNSVFKNAGFITIPVVCLNPSAEPRIINSNSVPLTVSYATVNGTAQAGVDYTAVSGTLVFTNGTVTNSFNVPILNNSLITGARTFGINLFNPIPVPPAKLVAPSNEVITVVDSNSGLSFSSANYTIFNGGQATITVLRVDNTNTTSTVNFATTDGGSAVAGTDYFPTNGVLTFTNGQTSATFTVTVITSSGVQPNKTILMVLSNPGNGVLMAPSAATLTIIDQNGSYVVPAGVSIFSTNGAPGGILQSNQQAMLWFAFRDAGGTNVGDLKATLLSANGVTSPSSTNGTATEDYGHLVVNGASIAREFTLTPVGTNSQNVLATFKLQDGANNIGTNSFTLTIGSWTTTFSNTNSIIIGPASPAVTPALAQPYPSIINVSNVGGVLIGTTTTLTNFTHTSPQAVGALVVSPGQQDTLIMANVGSVNVQASHVTLTFSDAATNTLPSNTQSAPITNGVYLPTQYGTIPNFP